MHRSNFFFQEFICTGNGFQEMNLFFCFSKTDSTVGWCDEAISSNFCCILSQGSTLLCCPICSRCSLRNCHRVWYQPVQCKIQVLHGPVTEMTWHTIGECTTVSCAIFAASACATVRQFMIKMMLQLCHLFKMDCLSSVRDNCLQISHYKMLDLY